MAILLSNNCRAISPTAAVDRVTTRVGRIRRATSAGSSNWAGPAVATPPTSSPNSVRKCPTTNRESPAVGVLGRRTSVKKVVNWTVSRFERREPTESAKGPTTERKGRQSRRRTRANPFGSPNARGELRWTAPA